jgi:hypothetical protein
MHTIKQADHQNNFSPVALGRSPTCLSSTHDFFNYNTTLNLSVYVC